MPYASNSEIPPAARKLPAHKQTIWRKAFNSAHKLYKGDEERAFATAWAAAHGTTKHDAQMDPETGGGTKEDKSKYKRPSDRKKGKKVAMPLTGDTWGPAQWEASARARAARAKQKGWKAGGNPEYGLNKQGRWAPNLKSVATGVRAEALLRAHQRELNSRRATAHNLGWSTSESHIASKTSQGILTTMEKKGGGFVHSWMKGPKR